MTGLAGLTFVLPLYFVLAFGAGGAEASVRVLGPLTTFALPAVAMIAFWWEDWPGSTLRAGWSGLTDTLLILCAGVVFTLVGQAAVGTADVRSLFDPDPGAGHLTTFPHTMPVAAGVFTAILQLTLVSEGWPLRRLGRVTSGVLALVAGWAVGVGAYLLVVGLDEPLVGGLRDPGGPVAPGAYGAWLTALGAWQIAFFVGLRGWPFTIIRRRAYRLPIGNIVVIAAGWATYAVLRHGLGWPTDRISAVCGSFIGAVLLVAMLFEAWPWTRLSPLPGRTGVMVTSVVVTGLLYWAMHAYAESLSWERAHPDDWVAYGALNALGMAIILHVAIWNRWPALAETNRGRGTNS